MDQPKTVQAPNFGAAWLALSIVLVLHVTDEALTGFLAVYNPTVLALRQKLPWWPMPVFTFRVWLALLILACVALLALTPLAFRGARGLRPVAYAFAAIMLLNGLGHTLGTVLGHTVESVRYARPMPGFYSSPLVLAGSIYLFYRLRCSRRTEAR